MQIIQPDMGIDSQSVHKFLKNKFEHNRHHQVAIEEFNFPASLINVEIDVPNSEFYFIENEVMYNWFTGGDSALISIDGPMMTITDNVFKYNGKLRKNENLRQKAGMFKFKFNKYFASQDNKSHKINRNVFQYIFCERGCAYRIEGSINQQLIFRSNVYSHIVAHSYGAVFENTGFFSKSQQTRSFFTLYFDEEKVSFTEGGALIIKNLNNIGVTFVKDSVFHETYEPNVNMRLSSQGSEGAAISLTNGGALFAENNVFKMEPTQLSQ